MSLTRASDPEVMQVKSNSNSSDKQSKNGDEEIEGMSVTDVPEFQDPAILFVKEVIRIRYNKEELLQLRDAPLSKVKPEFLESVEVSPYIFDPERWSADGKRFQPNVADGNANNRNSASGDEPRRRSGADPRERVRKEGDGIILSPQRRSFISGCFVPTRSGAGDGVRGMPSSGQPSGGRSHSPLGVGGGKGDSHGVREIQPNSSRRIGSGRILRDNWDFDKPDADEFGGNSYSRNQRGERDEKYERRSFGREYEITRDRGDQTHKERRNNSRFDRRRISENRDIEEPEWFSGGPISQNDTIELRGFDDNERPGKKKPSPSREKRAKEWSRKKKNSDVTEEAKEESKAESIAATKPTIPDGTENDKQNKTEEEEKKTEDKAQGITGNQNNLLMNEQPFNFDDILKSDTLTGLLTNGIEGEGDNQAKSRFSRWFKKSESPEDKQQHNSRRSSLHDDHLIFKDLLKDISETSVSIPGDSDAYFAPISPAANTNTGFPSGHHIMQQPTMREQQQSLSIMEMLQRGKTQHPVEQGVKSVKQPAQMPGKILSLDELEAKMRQNSDNVAGMPQKHQQKPDEVMTAAFKKLLAEAQITGNSMNSNGPINKSQPMSIMEMLNHSQQQDEAARLSAASANNHLLVGPASPSISHHLPHHQVHLVNEQVQKLQQVQAQQYQNQKQLEMLNKLINATTTGNVPGQMRSSPSFHDIGAQSRELLNRPEAQAILQAMHQRIPSPRELQVHTQNILQRALIKKKLEEQQENYRKKQEMQRGSSPASGSTVTSSATKSVSSPTPLAFTPTSVLRKMTADKDDAGRPLTGIRTPQQPQLQQWNQFSTGKQPAGRPIVKANNNYQTPEQFFNQQHQQQRMFMQATAAAQSQPLQSQVQQQQRKPSNGAQYSTGQVPMTGGISSSSQYSSYPTNTSQQFTQQQLRAQHQHRPANQQQQTQQPQQAGFQQQPQQQGQQGIVAWQQFFNSGQQAAPRTNVNTVSRANDLSPTTTNQLARWFSPDLLERARVGELPSTAGLGQTALSLEEIERQTAPPVHN